MAHVSGNPTWEDYPSLDTPVTAATLENVEALLDVLYNPPSFMAVSAGAFSTPVGFGDIPLGTTVLDTHGWKSGNAYVPQRAGYYLCIASYAQGAWPIGTAAACMPQKNHSAADLTGADVPFLGGASFAAYRMQGTELIHCNGSTDAITGVIYQASAAAVNVDAGSLQCWWFRP